MLINYGSCAVCFSNYTGQLYTLTFETTPEAESIDLIAPGYVQIGNMIRVPANTIVRCTAHAIGYVPYTTEITITEDTKKTLNFEPGVLLTINPTPADANIVFTIDGYDYSESGLKTMEVPIGRPFSYTVSKDEYNTVTDTITITEATTLNVQLTPLQHLYAWTTTGSYESFPKTVYTTVPNPTVDSDICDENGNKYNPAVDFTPSNQSATIKSANTTSIKFDYLKSGE